MNIVELSLLAVGLSMDAFAASVCKGLGVGKVKTVHCLKVGLWFGSFQAAMPLAGYYLASLFSSYVAGIGSFLSFIILVTIGINMIKEALSDKTVEERGGISLAELIPLALATSIDAFAAGTTFAFYKGDIYNKVLLIGTTTFVMSACGIKIGAHFGNRNKSKAEIMGGIMLIIVGICLIL